MVTLTGMYVNARYLNSTKPEEFMYLVFIRMPGESYCRRLGSLLLYLCYVYWVLINFLVCWFCTSVLGLCFRFVPSIFGLVEVTRQSQDANFDHAQPMTGACMFPVIQGMQTPPPPTIPIYLGFVSIMSYLMYGHKCKSLQHEMTFVLSYQGSSPNTMGVMV